MTKSQLIEHYEKSEGFFWSNICLATAQINGADVFTSGINNLYLNSAIQRTPLTESTFQGASDCIQAFFKTHNIPWVWIIREGLVPPSLITTKSLELLDTSTAMFCNLASPAPLNSVKDLQIRENNRELSDWGECLSKAYQTPSDTTAQYQEVIKQYMEAHKKKTGEKANFHHFVGYLDNLPVSCLTLSIQENRGRIDDVGTIPAQQHKGYATQLVTHVLTVAKNLGADICFLESSEKGIKVYERLGFQPLFSNMYFREQGAKRATL